MKNVAESSKCRFCETPLKHTFVNLGMSPLCQHYITTEELNTMEPFYSLHAFVCDNCFLVQLRDFAAPSAMLNDFTHFSSYSDSWLQHSKRYTEQVVGKFSLNEKSLVAEIASNEGYLIQHFQEKGIPVLGIGPAANLVDYAITQKRVPTEPKFFGCDTAREMVSKYGKSDLLVGNNILSHVSDINDFVSGLKIFLSQEGAITMEFPHLLRLIERNQFDIIYHGHFSYLSFTTVEKIFEYHGLALFDVEELPTHGGSIRIYAKHIEDTTKAVSFRVKELLKREQQAGILSLGFYKDFEEKVRSTKRKILHFLIDAKNNGKKIAVYGAHCNGNTLLNYCGLRMDFIDFAVDRNPEKQGNFLPGTLIPVYSPEKIREAKPDYVFVLSSNLKEEIMESMCFIQEWGGKFVTAIPEVKVFDPLWLVHRYRKAS